MFYMSSMERAVSYAQIVIDCVPDKLKIKQELFKGKVEKYTCA